MSFSTDNLTSFHSPQALQQMLLRTTALDILFLEEDEDIFYYRFNREWKPGVNMVEVDNGAGDHLFIFFNAQGAVIKGFDHESPVSPHAQKEYAVWPGMFKGIPDGFMQLLDDKSIDKEETTFCIWFENASPGWKKGEVVFKKGEDDGSSFLLSMIYDSAAEYKDWADDYYDVNIPLRVLEKSFETNQLTDEMLLSIRKDCDLPSVKKRLAKIGY